MLAFVAADLAGDSSFGLDSSLIEFVLLAVLERSFLRRSCLRSVMIVILFLTACCASACLAIRFQSVSFFNTTIKNPASGLART